MLGKRASTVNTDAPNGEMPLANGIPSPVRFPPVTSASSIVHVHNINGAIAVRYGRCGAFRRSPASSLRKRRHSSARKPDTSSVEVMSDIEGASHTLSRAVMGSTSGRKIGQNTSSGMRNRIWRVSVSTVAFTAWPVASK